MHIPSALGRWARSVTLPGSGDRIFCYDAGRQDAPGMLLVHGLGDEADTWRRVIAPLAERHRVVAPDLPGFGRSPLPAHRCLSPRYLSAVLRELVEVLGMREATLVGSSLGAALAQIVALDDPRLASRLILVDGGLLPMTRFQAGLIFMLLPGLGERRYRSLARDLDAAYASLMPYYASLGNLPGEEREFLRRRVAERVASVTQMRAYFSSFRSFVGWALVKGRRSAHRAGLLGVPTLYVWGGKDHIIPVELGRAAQAMHPGAALSIIADAGHLPHQETPAEFLRVVDQSGTRSQ
jgi:pimeloyl-ACP methyl ester carboxylesterase